MAESINPQHSSNESGKSYIRTWRWTWIVFTLLVFSSLIKLGVWQWQRADEKSERLARIQSFTQTQPLTLDQIDLQQATEHINDLPVKLQGQFLNQYPLLLDNQTDQGRTGYRVFVPFADELSNQTVIVNLGWLAGDVDRSKLPEIEAITGVQTLTGHLRVMQPPLFYRQQPLSAGWPQRQPHIDPVFLAEQLKMKLAPVVIYLDPEVAIGYKKNWNPIVMPPEKHRGYAWQWFSLALAFLSLMIWAGYKNKGSNHGRWSCSNIQI
ncbi:SURF1 family protein [Thalassotalea mangrovi]|uniref:SURF1-like protein n=1 Tax=Thalassotalea mangrovi TaxID=2572245 RepID=A0A4U1B543_9GAMM|nr:SURF1 family protein [Thalassotalea mangrovi]TKB45550.1 SURF1 family protein [Thalassotalea mangrovi]